MDCYDKTVPNRQDLTVEQESMGVISTRASDQWSELSGVEKERGGLQRLYK